MKYEHKVQERGWRCNWGVISIKGVIKWRKRWQRKYIKDSQSDRI